MLVAFATSLQVVLLSAVSPCLLPALHSFSLLDVSTLNHLLVIYACLNHI